MPSKTENRKTETIEIDGMTCVGCARTLENEFRKFDGIDYSVSFAKKRITVTYTLTDYQRKDFENAIKRHGYRIKGND